jgi:hypothetical protein
MTTTTHTSDIYNAMMNRVMNKGAFRRTEYEDEFRSILEPHIVRPAEPTECDEVGQTEMWKTYPQRVKNYENQCYAAFLAWNRKCLEEMNSTELSHLSWLVGKIDSSSLEFMDEEVGSSARAYRFFISAQKNIVLTSPR